MYDHPRFIGPLRSPDWYHHGQPWRCSSCGIRPTNKITSGSPECGWCWDWRKLDGPAAAHWFRVAGLFTSNIDMYDWETFITQRCGVTPEDFTTAIKVAEQIRDTCKEMFKDHTGRTDEDLDAILVKKYKELLS